MDVRQITLYRLRAIDPTVDWNVIQKNKDTLLISTSTEQVNLEFSIQITDLATALPKLAKKIISLSQSVK